MLAANRDQDLRLSNRQTEIKQFTVNMHWKGEQDLVWLWCVAWEGRARRAKRGGGA